MAPQAHTTSFFPNQELYASFTTTHPTNQPKKKKRRRGNEINKYVMQGHSSLDSQQYCIIFASKTRGIVQTPKTNATFLHYTI